MTYFQPTEIKKFIRNHPALNQASDLAVVCQPLQKLGIVYFSHVIIDEDNKMSCLGIRPEFFKLYFDKGYYNYDLHKADIAKKEQLILWDSIERQGSSAALHEDFMSFQQGHTFSIVYTHQKQREIFHFAGKLGDTTINHRYYQHLDFIKKFIAHFKDKVAGHKELSAAYEMKLSLSAKTGGYLVSDDLVTVNHDFLQKKSRYYIPDFNTYLTQREVECLHWMSLGKTFDETGAILQITHRTVKAHVQNAKIKLNCYSQFQLGQAYAVIKRYIV